MVTRTRSLLQRSAGLWPALLLFVLPFCLFRQGLGTGTPPFGGDVVVLNYPLLTLIKHQLASGLFPLWNTYAGGGYPLVPFSALIFYPPLWALRALSVNDTITLLDVAHLSLAGIGVYALAGVTGASRLGRLLGALAFVLSGLMVAHLYAGHLFEMGVIAWMPWVFLAAHRLIDRPALPWALTLGLVSGLQVLANGIGFLVFTLYPVVALLALGLGRTMRRSRGDGLRLLALVALAGLVAAALAAVILLPFAQVLGQSIRSGGLDYRGASKISLAPAALLMLFAPGSVGIGPDDTYWLNQFVDGYWHEFALYVGLLPLLATLAACLYCRRVPWVGFYMAIAMGGLLLALGRYTPIYGLAFHLPLLNLVRVPARWLLASTLGVGVLAGPGFDWLLAQRGGAAALLRALAVPLLVLAALAVVLVVALQALYMQGSASVDLQPRFAQTLMPAFGRFLLFGALLALILAVNAERLIRPRAAASLLLVAAFLDLWTAASGSIRFTDPAQYYRPSIVGDQLRADANTYRVLTIDRSMPNRQGMVSDAQYDAEDFAPVTLRAYFSITHPYIFDAHIAAEISNADQRDLIHCYDQRFADLVGIGAVTFELPSPEAKPCPVAAPPSALQFRSAIATSYWLLPNGKSWNATPFWGVTYLYRNPTALPRTSLLPLGAARAIETSVAQRLAVMRSGFDGRRELVLDRHPAKVPTGLGWLQDLWARFLAPVPAPLPRLAPGQSTVLIDDSNSIQVGVNARSASYLLLDDAYYPGWQVTVDGRPATIQKADYLLRAVRVSPGTHRLVFTYAPLSYLVGIAISGATALLVLGLLARYMLLALRRGRNADRRLPQVEGRSRPIYPVVAVTAPYAHMYWAAVLARRPAAHPEGNRSGRASKPERM